MKWEKKVAWNREDKFRRVRSSEVLPEDLQEVRERMILVGADVVSLYPSMNVREVAKMMKEAILTSPMKWESVDLLECARYVALNWDEVTCVN